MGGFGSGRCGGSPTSESVRSYVLNISVLKAALRRGGRVLSGVSLPGGTPPILIVVDTKNSSAAYVELHHQTRDAREGNRRFVNDRIRLSSTTPTYGGTRWWFICPVTGRRTTKLFLPNGGSYFWSRQAYGLGYACQREDTFSRLQRRSAMLNQQLGGGWTSWNIPPPKPKGTHWRTYVRKYERWQRVVEKAEEEFARMTARILSRPSVPGWEVRGRRRA